MSATKKTAKKKVARKAASKKKAAAKKKAGRQAAAKKKAAKKKTAKKKPAARKAPARAAAKKKAAAPKKKIPARKTAAKKAAKAPPRKKEKEKKADAESEKKAPTRKATAKAARATAKPVPLSEIPHPKYGLKYECFSCGTKFYLMGRPELICPKCGTDQNEKPALEPKAPKAKVKPKSKAVRPMAPLLDDDDDTGTATDTLDGPILRGLQSPDEMFDDAEEASAIEDLEEEVSAPSKDD